MGMAIRRGMRGVALYLFGISRFWDGRKILAETPEAGAGFLL
jgi:hypothetical protein